MIEHDKNELAKLRKLIKSLLKDCSNIDTPNVCELVKTPKGYEEIETTIINLALKEGMPIDSAIAQIESNLTFE